MPLSTQNIEAELSYAYLHAVGSVAGMSCKLGDRHDDSNGVDAEVNYRGVTSHPYITQVQLNVQLKATIADPGSDPNFVKYNFKGIERYNKLRKDDSIVYKILIVLFLPNDASSWLKCTPTELVLKHCAYWVCLYGAQETINETSVTIHLPRTQMVTPDELIRLSNLAVNKTIPNYTTPI